MRYISLLLATVIGLGVYYVYLKQAAPDPNKNTVATQEISTTGVEMDLNAIAQAERAYYLQNGAYGSMDQLVSGGTMNVNRDGRDGYSYTVEATPSGFTASATHPDIPAGVVATAGPLHYPAFSIDQTMQLQRGN